MATDTLLSPQQLYSMSDSQRTAYYASLSDEQASQERAALASYVRQISEANRMYLQQSLDTRAICPPTGGGTSATYNTATTLNFNFPTAGGAFIREFEVTAVISVTPATGSSATYGWTKAGAYAFFKEISIIYNGRQGTIKPYFLKVLDTIRYKKRLPTFGVISGLGADSTITGIVNTPQPTLTANQADISKFKFRIPLQMMRWSPIGMLPSQGQGTKGQLNITTCTTLGAANADPMDSPILFTTGSGHALTLNASTVTVEAIYNTGRNMGSKDALGLQLAGLPTIQYIVDQELNPLTAASVRRQAITTLQKHVFAASVIIDGAQSTDFSTVANISSIELDMDAAGQNKFWEYGTANNTTMYDYYAMIRHRYEQDLDPGVIIWCDALHANTIDMDNANGQQILNMSPGGWTDVNFGVQVAAVTTTNFTPRVITQLFSLNDEGLRLG